MAFISKNRNSLPWMSYWGSPIKSVNRPVSRQTSDPWMLNIRSRDWWQSMVRWASFKFNSSANRHQFDQLLVKPVYTVVTQKKMPCISSNDQSLTIFVVFVNLFPNTPLISVGCGNSQLAYRQLTMERKTKDAKTSQLLPCNEQHDAMHAFLLAFLVFWLLKAFLHHQSPFTHSHTFTHSQQAVSLLDSHLLIRSSYTNIHKLMEQPSGAVWGSVSLSCPRTLWHAGQ